MVEIIPALQSHCWLVQMKKAGALLKVKATINMEK
jgi:hypothetical protein